MEDSGHAYVLGKDSLPSNKETPAQPKKTSLKTTSSVQAGSEVPHGQSEEERKGAREKGRASREAMGRLWLSLSSADLSPSPSCLSPHRSLSSQVRGEKGRASGYTPPFVFGLRKRDEECRRQK